MRPENKVVQLALIAVCPHCSGTIGWCSPRIGSRQLDLERAEWRDRGLNVEEFPADVPIDITGHAATCPKRARR